MKPWTYILLDDLPPPPARLLEQVDLSISPEINNTGYLQMEPLINWKGYSGPAALNVRILFNDEYTQWVRENITAEFENASLNYVVGPPGIKTTAPHRDFTRDYVLIYNVDPGGDDVKLQFWQEKGHSIERNPGDACGRYQDLELLDTVVGPPNRWYLTNATILHSTDNMTRQRVNLQVSFNKGNNFAENLILKHK